MTGASIPLRMSHEFAGQISEVGADVTDHKVGAPVTVNPIRSCGEGRYCVAGKGHLCTSIARVGISAEGEWFRRKLGRPCDERRSFA